MRRVLLSILVALPCLIPGMASGLAFALPQDRPPAGRERTGLAEDQALLLRQLARLKQTMEVLATRYEAEGRTHAAKLLRDGLKHLDERNVAQSQKTLEELMGAAREDLEGGLSVRALETQQEVVKSLERLYSILTDRQGVQDLEKSLATLKELREELKQLETREAALEKETQELRERSATPEQKALAEGIAKALEKERDLLARTEAQSRASSVHELSELERALAELAQREATDRAVLESWKPEERAALERANTPLERAQANAQRASRLAQAASALRQAAQTARANEGDLSEAQRELERAAERDERHQQASGDPTAAKSAEALRKGAQALAKSPAEAAGREATAKELEQLAAALEAQSAEQRDAAAREASDANAALESLKDPASAAGRVAKDVREALERAQAAAGSPPSPSDRPQPDGSQNPASDPKRAAQELERATNAARQAAREGLDELDTLKQALAASQAQAAEEARRIARDLATLPEGANEAGRETQAALERAASAQSKSSEQAASEQAEQASQSASAAEQALREAQSALQRAKSSAERAAAQSPANQELTKAQEELAQEVQSLEQQAQQAGTDPQSQAAAKAAQSALQQAREAMQQASRSLSQGQSSSASEQQQQALQALEQAQQSAQASAQPRNEADRKRAEELAKEQEEIKKQLLALAERNKKRDGARPAPSLEQAAEASRNAQRALEQGDLEEAQQQEQEAQRQMQQANAELGQEEEQYQKLRAEELLFRIAEEVRVLAAEHQKQIAATVEVDAQRKAGDKPTHTQRLRLRKISQAEGTLAARSGEIQKAIAAEQSLVFAEVLDQVRRDLERIARDLGETGDWQSGERVQGLQEDVAGNLKWLAEALDDEKERRRQENQEQQGGDQGGQNQRDDGTERLVPDAAELKMLRRLELEALTSLENLRRLHPEIDGGETVDRLVLEDVARLAYRHQRTAELFQKFRKRLGLPDPGAADGSKGAHDAHDGENDSGDGDTQHQ